MGRNEKIALLASVGIIMTEGTDKELDDRIVDYFRQIDLDSHEFMLTANASSEEILDAAITKIQEEVSKNGSSNTVMSANAYETSSHGGESKPIQPSSVSETSLTEISTKVKSTSNKEDVTSRLAGTLPTASRMKLDGMVNARWDNLMNMAKTTTVGGYCVDTEVRKFMVGQKFTVNNDDYIKTFLEKYNSTNVIDDNKYGEPDSNGQRAITEEGENMKAYNAIVNKLQKKEQFDVRVPEVQNQKVIGIVFNRTGADVPEIVKAIKDVPIFVLTEMGGKVPGQPGIEVTGIVMTSSSKAKNGVVNTEEKQSIAYKHRGKVDAMKDPDSKYIKYTSKALDAEHAKREFGVEKKDYSVSSVESFKYKDKDGKDRVVRVRGKIPVPFFARLEQYMALGRITAVNRVEALTEADRGQVSKLYAAALTSSHLQYEFATAAGLSDLVGDIEKSSGTPPLNVTNIA